MDREISKLSVFFENPFWVGVFEKYEKGKLYVCKVTFGSEPKDGEIFEFILKNYYNLKFSPSVDFVISDRKINPKKLQRNIKKEQTKSYIGTKSQQALKLQHEQIKTDNKALRKKLKHELKDKKFVLKQQKKKEKRQIMPLFSFFNKTPN